MQVNFGGRYQSLAHGLNCACHDPLVLDLFNRVGKGISRRSVLSGIAATLAAPLLGLAAPSFAQAAAKPTLLKNLRIFDGQSSELLEGKSVLVDGNTIKALPGAGETVADANVIDCAGGTVMPGLIDSHWHTLLAGISQLAALTADIPYVHLVAAQEAERTVMRGFTTVRDVGGPAFAVKRAIDEGRVAGPRIYPSGAMISQTSGHGDFRQRSDLPRTAQTDLSAAEVAGISAIADGEAEVLRRVREQLMLGASQIKIMAGGGLSSEFDPLDSIQYSEAEIKAAVGAAADWGTYVCAHVYVPKGIRRALACGVRSIEHGQLADEETVRMMADQDAWWSIQPFLADEDANTHGSATAQAQRKVIAEGTMRSFDMGQKHKVRMVWGTDILFAPGATASQGRQLTKIVRWFDAAEVLRMATSRSAELLALSGARNPYPGKLGVVAPGALADLLVIAGDPLKNIDLLADPDKNMKVIMKDGRIHKNMLAG
ncbi:MAG: amidohydrolase family protein [Pseudomonadota bacterium]